MLKKERPRRLTDEQRERIMNEPGVVVHRRKGPRKKEITVPKLRVLVPLTASELIDDDDEEESYE